MTQLLRRQLLRAAGATALTLYSLGSMAEMPSTLRSLRESYEALGVGASTALAIQLMGTPKTSAERTVLGVLFCEMTWVDISLIRYTARFAADRLVFKSSTTTTIFNQL